MYCEQKRNDSDQNFTTCTFEMHVKDHPGPGGVFVVI